MLLKRSKDIPSEIKNADMTDWYESLNDQEKVKVGRYLPGANKMSSAELSLFIMRKANAEENYSVTVMVGENILKDGLSETARFDVQEEIIPAYYHIGKYEECRECCENNLDILSKIMQALKERNNGDLPEKIICRNYLVNVLIGGFGDYDAAETALNRFIEMGIISEEEAEYRKQSHKVHKLQHTFDGIYSGQIRN